MKTTFEDKDKEDYDCVNKQLVDTPEEWMQKAWEGKVYACKQRENPMQSVQEQNTALKEENNALKRG